LVAAVAPNLNVAILTSEKGTVEPVIRPGDWLEIPEGELLCRLDPTLDDKKAQETAGRIRAIMRPVLGKTGELYGRAFIKPKRWYGGNGWVTVSGLRTQRLSNIEGVLMGEAVTAARDTARPIVNRDALAEWATEQAKLIAKGIADREQQALSAEVVLECGGDICDLAIIRWRDEWLASAEFATRLQDVDELLVSFDGDFQYDEDEDDVHPRDFKSNFVLNDDVAIVLKHDGTVLGSRTKSWPRSLTGAPHSGESNVATRIREIISGVWDDGCGEGHDTRAVGTVYGTDIERYVTVFRRHRPEDKEA
jgi:hypothetical protein